MAANLFAPLVIMIVSVPLIFRMIPRNRIYGFRAIG